ncbi:FixH family protein [Siccirubricoccus sp. KC 17139]|uniref:FixH family protein n=1 Tax=Siccirubricoccus soli TaxID=2899147 RepID=A0ABT1D4F5_9PROT|nr:FixH family protein [Siccirubricoccus soli]MCO6416155.1 FixH family protein [Siccirubricoccus soli]MCP2682289.1 FixH family protein [Siccirubricoccus soli]
MLSRLLRAAALGTGAAVSTSLLAPAAFAAASDYRFELASARPAGPGKTDVTVRLVHAPDNKPVPDAVIFQTRADMAPAGMPTMTGNVAPQAGQQPGTYRFQIDTGMAGGWALTLAAKVQGEPETVRATVTFNAAQ